MKLNAHSKKLEHVLKTGTCIQKVAIIIIMPRKYFKRTGKRDKYSVEITNFRTSNLTDWVAIAGDGTTTADSQQTNFTIVPPAEFEGMRKVKHLTISMGNITGNGPLWYVLAYVPQGTDPLPIRTPIQGLSCNMYVANQFVMSCGTLDFDAGPQRIYSKVSRNLNSGDKIVLILASHTTGQANFSGTIQYAITLQ